MRILLFRSFVVVWEPETRKKEPLKMGVFKVPNGTILDLLANKIVDTGLFLICEW